MNLDEEQVKQYKPVILVIFDGFGIAPSWGGNSITQAKMPNYFKALREMPNTQLNAAGEAVGLPDSEEGNSEVGHFNIGSGIALEQNLKRINKNIDESIFFSNKILLEAFNRAKLNNKAVHIMGIMSHGGVHGDLNHLYALLNMAKKQNFNKVLIHLFTDGRDAPPYQAHIYLSELSEKIEKIGIGEVCSIIGRYYAMDRDHRWNRTEKAYDLLTEGIGKVANNVDSAISDAYKSGFSDEFIPPYIIRSGKSNGIIQDGDSVIFYNFREDRARQLTEAFIADNFNDFLRKKTLKNLFFATFVKYSEKLATKVVFPNQKVEWPLARILSSAGKQQLHLAETEKYAHVTYFFDGGHEAPFNGEDRVLIPSPKVPTYDMAPKMSATEITKTLLQAIQKNIYDFIVVNYANPDMVGHTGNINATVIALNYLDQIMGQVIKAVIDVGGIILFTADHGNCEEMINPVTGEKSTDHTNNKVPFIIIGNSSVKNIKLKNNGTLADIAPTVLDIMHLQQPTQMTGKSLIDNSAGSGYNIK